MSNHTFDLVDAAVSAARRGWRGDPSGNGCGYTKAGVILNDLLPEADRPAIAVSARPAGSALTAPANLRALCAARSAALEQMERTAAALCAAIIRTTGKTRPR